MKTPASLLLLLALASTDASACSCVARTLDDFIANSDSIHVAHLQQAKLVKGGSGREWPSVEASFEVRNTLKGKARTRKLTLKTGMGGGDCGIPMTVAETYILFLEKGQNEIGICDGSGPMYGLEEDEVSAKVKAAMAKRPASSRKQ